MDDKKNEIQTLIDLGGHILSLPKGKADDFVSSIETYARLLDALLRDLASMKISKESKPLMEELMQVHGRVMEGADARKADAGKFLGNLQERGRGLRAYVDPLPKRISVRRPREG